MKDLIKKYKVRIATTKLEDEVYKWELVHEFKNRPDTDAPDFYQEIKSIKYNNLIYAMGIAVIYHIAKEKPEELRMLFKYLFDESKELSLRVNFFNEETLKIYRELGEKLQHHQDERSIASYLTYYNPDKYTFYKSSYYKRYCKLIGVKEAGKNEKYVHYLALLNQFIIDYIVPDQELIDQVKGLIPDYYDGTNNLLLAQDILYQTLSKDNDTINYWIFQGNPKVFDFKTAFEQGLMDDWTVTAHKDKIKVGDKVILWITGDKPGCYALAEVTSPPMIKSDSKDSHLWKTEVPNNLRAGINITHDIYNQPVTKNQLSAYGELKSLNVGNRGTNFSATKQEFNTILNIVMNRDKTKYWLYAPGEQANNWDEFFNQGIMGLGWDELGDLNQYANKDEIVSELQKIEKTTGSKMNDANANFEFKNTLSIGDIVIAKKGRKEYLGYGIVTSDYYFDSTRKQFQKCRKVDWKKRGVWPEVNQDIVLKTLTDITKYPDYVNKLIELIGIEKEATPKVENNNICFPLNTILYGPPGTGKTYTTINKAISIIDNKEESLLAKSYRNRIDLKNRFNELLIEDWENPNGQIIFTTFHQSMSYEDFIEGIKPGVNDKQKVIYEVVPGIFKMIANIARDNWLDAHQGKIQQLSFEDAFSRLKEEWFENQDLKFPMKREGYDFTIIGFTKLSIQFKKASGGTGHTLSISTLREYFYNRREVRPTGVGIYYPPVLEKLKSFQPELKVEKKLKNYVLIIDEINRGNVPQIFGELITMIEDDKRLGNPEALEVMLPYSKEKFGVPPNLYIIGTMNTADRSVEALDAALRRRFYFEEMMPKPELIRPSVILQRLWIKYTDLEWKDPNWLQVENDYLTFHGAKIIDRKKYEELENETDIVNYQSVFDNIIVYDGLNLELILTTINKRIEKLLDKDHQIGHSYFMSVVNLDDLRSSFQNKIIPLLQEYFFGDYGKIGLILGKGFFEPLVTLKDNLFADFDEYDASEFSERPIYKIKDITNIPDIEFIDAINSLLKK